MQRTTGPVDRFIYRVFTLNYFCLSKNKKDQLRHDKGGMKQIPRSGWVLGYTHRSPVNSQRSDQSVHDTRI